MRGSLCQSADDWAPHREGNFPTPTGKCEFKSTITGGGNFVVPLFRQGYSGDQDGTPVDAAAALHSAERKPADDACAGQAHIRSA